MSGPIVARHNSNIKHDALFRFQFLLIMLNPNYSILPFISFLLLACVSCILFLHLLPRPLWLLLLQSQCITEGEEVHYIISALESRFLCVCERVNESVCLVKPNCSAF
jgi:hypothetical protein